MLLKLRAGLSDLATIRDFILKTSESIHVDESIIGDLVLAVDEAVTNIISYGYQGNAGDIEIEFNNRDQDLVIILRDRAPAFNPELHKKDIPEEPLSQQAPGGYGLHLIKKLMDEVIHRISNQGGNELYLIKRGAISAG